MSIRTNRDRIFNDLLVVEKIQIIIFIYYFPQFRSSEYGVKRILFWWYLLRKIKPLWCRYYNCSSDIGTFYASLLYAFSRLIYQSQSLLGEKKKQAWGKLMWSIHLSVVCCHQSCQSVTPVCGLRWFRCILYDRPTPPPSHSARHMPFGVSRGSGFYCQHWHIPTAHHHMHVKLILYPCILAQ